MNTRETSIPDQPPDLDGGHSSTAPRQNKVHQCHVCNRTYERRDHLSRHVKSHSQERKHVCSECGKGFTRGDLLTRHRVVHLKDASIEPLRQRTVKACQACIAAKTKCTEERPCARCRVRNESCISTQSKARALDRNNDEAAHSMRGSNEMSEARGLDLETTVVHDGGLLAFQDAGAYDTGEVLGDFAFPDFFDQIMNMPPDEMQEPSLAPPNIFDVTSDDFGFEDYDFTLLADGLTRPPSAQDMREDHATSGVGHRTPQTDAQQRVDAFEKSPWSWNSWIPTKNHSTFSGQEINVSEQRVSAIDQLTPSDGVGPILAMDLEVRDRILRLVTTVAASRLSISSFPSPDLLKDIINVFVLQEQEAIDSYVHCVSLDCQAMQTEMLLSMLSKGATYVALKPVWKIGLVFQEIVRLATGEIFEKDNSATRQLQPLQAFMMCLDVGLWSGFRRKTEIASSFLQSPVTMLSWSDAFRRFRYSVIEPSTEDDELANQSKWQRWKEQEGFKRLVLHAFIHDSQASLAHARDPLLSPSRMQLPLPLSRELWHAPDAESWRIRYLSLEYSSQSDLPPVVAILSDIQMLEKHRQQVDLNLSMLLACHLIAYDVLHYRQQATVLSVNGTGFRRDRDLALASRQKEIKEDLSTMHSFCDVQRRPLPEAIFTLNYLMMLLHTPFDDIELFSGRSGDHEARRVYPFIKAWTHSAESRMAIWHAGQAIAAARSFEKTKLRDFYAVTLHHTALTLWVYGMITSNAARMSRSHSPLRDSASGACNVRDADDTASREDVMLDGEDNKQAKAFRHLGQGRPCLGKLHGRQGGVTIGTVPGAALARACPLESPRDVMLLASQVLEDNFPRSTSGLPPLVDNLVKLMVELSRFSGRDKA